MSHMRRRVSLSGGDGRVNVQPADKGESDCLMLPRIVCVIRTGSRNCRDEWVKLQRKLGLVATVVQDNSAGNASAWTTAYDVSGTPQALSKLTSGVHSLVVQWEYAVSGGLTLKAFGAGEEPSRKTVPSGTPKAELRLDSAGNIIRTRV